ncbi:MAG: hypothetical protein BroJett030_21530 [Alphaproteobacteria bacterium]|nr:MAG: hypothetical protein BroJett030_21530 [Alphaproteobacteria bacterium]
MTSTAPRRLMSATVASVLAALMLAPAAARADLPDPTLAETVSGASLSGSFLAAQLAAKDNDDAAAVAFYERALALDPANEELKQFLFLALTANGRIADAVDIGRQLPQAGPAGGVVRLVVAVHALKQKSWAKVSELLAGSNGGELDRLVELLLKAWALYGAGNVDGALDTSTAFAGADWANVVRDYHSGLIAAAAARDAEAEKFFRQAIADRAAAAVLSEVYLRAVEALVRVQAKLGKLDEARQTLASGKELLPTHPPFLALGRRLEEGLPLAPLLTSAPQGGSELLYNVGAAISRQGGASFAQSYLQLADYLNPGSDVVVLALADVFENHKDHERANGYYERIDAKSPYWRRARLQYALNLNDLDQVDKAKETLKVLIAEDPDDLLAYSTLGSVHSQHEEYAEAAEVYDRAVARIATPEQSHWDLFYRRGIAHERLKQWEKAEPNFKQALALNPDQPNVLNYLGYSWIDMGINLEEGMAMIRKAVELRPNSGYIVDSLGWAHYRLGQYEDAVRELERAVELMPQDPVINDHLGDAYWKAGRKLEATFQWNHALASKPEPDDEKKIRAKLEHGLRDEATATSAAD